MKLLIDMPEEEYNTVVANSEYYKEMSWGSSEVWDAIKNGIVIPRGHGDLIDRSKLAYFRCFNNVKDCPSSYDFKCNNCDYGVTHKFRVDSAEVIIPADKGDQTMTHEEVTDSERTKILEESVLLICKCLDEQRFLKLPKEDQDALGVNLAKITIDLNTRGIVADVTDQGNINRNTDVDLLDALKKISRALHDICAHECYDYGYTDELAITDKVLKGEYDSRRNK